MMHHNSDASGYVGRDGTEPPLHDLTIAKVLLQLKSSLYRTIVAIDCKYYEDAIQSQRDLPAFALVQNSLPFRNENHRWIVPLQTDLQILT